MSLTRLPLHAELAEARAALVRLASLVKQAIADAAQALQRLDAAAARDVVARDREIDAERTRLEREYLRLIALQQPLARDLRAIGAALRILVDLERIADHASDVARVACAIENTILPVPLTRIMHMATMAHEMVARAIDAFVREDAVAATEVAAHDEDVDAMFAAVFSELVARMQARPDAVPVCARLLLVAGHLERIADHATNLMESVVYAETGVRPELNA